MGIILASTGLPLLTSTRAIASPVYAPVPPVKPTEPTGPTGPLTPPIGAYDPDSLLTSPSNGAGGYKVDFRGVTFNFNKPVRYLWSANGDPVVISHADYLTSGTTITSITPAGTTSGSGAKINGTEKNPVFHDFGEETQGFDDALDNGAKSGNSPYVNGLNIDPGNTGSPIAIKQGDAFVLVKAVRDPARLAASTETQQWQLIQKYVPLAVMNSLPPGAGTWFRPAVSGAAKTWPSRRLEDIDHAHATNSPLRHLANPPGLNDVSSALNELVSRNMQTLPMWAHTSEEARRLTLSGETSTATGYSGQYADDRAKYMCALHIDPIGNATKIANRKILLCLLTQWGIDLDGAYQAGHIGDCGAGQWYGQVPFFYLAAFMMKDAAMLSRAQAFRSNSIGQPFWVEAGAIGYPTNETWSNIGQSYAYGETYLPVDLGIPDWCHDGWQSKGIHPSSCMSISPAGTLHTRMNPSPYSAYRTQASSNLVFELMAIGLLRNGPRGETGDAAIRNTGSPYDSADMDTRNIRSAAIAYMDRHRTFELWKIGASDWPTGPNASVPAFYEAWRDFVPQTRWTGRADAQESLDLVPFGPGPGSGQVLFDLTQEKGVIHNWSTQLVTAREIAYSQDNIQFVGPIWIGLAFQQTLSGYRPGTPHWFRYRQVNASGAGRWSRTWRQIHDHSGVTALEQTDRGKLTTPGTASGTLKNTVDPAIHHKPYDHWMPWYEPAPAAVAVGRVLYAGMGYWTGGSGGLSVSYQWKRNGANVGTGQSYTVPAGSGATIQCVVTVNGTAANSNSVKVS